MNFKVEVFETGDNHSIGFAVHVNQKEAPSVLDYMNLIKDLESFKAHIVQQASRAMSKAHPGVMNASNLSNPELEELMRVTPFPTARPATEIVN